MECLIFILLLFSFVMHFLVAYNTLRFAAYNTLRFNEGQQAVNKKFNAVQNAIEDLGGEIDWRNN